MLETVYSMRLSLVLVVYVNLAQVSLHTCLMFHHLKVLWVSKHHFSLCPIKQAITTEYTFLFYFSLWRYNLTHLTNHWRALIKGSSPM